MENENPKALPLRTAYPWLSNHGLEKEAYEIRNMEVEWDLPYSSTLRRGYIVDLLQKRNLFDQFKAECWTNGNSKEGKSLVRRCLKIYDRYQEFLSGDIGDEGSEDTQEDLSEQAFAAEADLRDFLAENLSIIEPNLKLNTDAKGREGIEYPVDKGRIDLLAVDLSGHLVVIELKLSKGRNKALGQLIYYMSWIDEKLSQKPCRGMIIAREISPELQMAAKRVEGIQLYKYHLQVTVEKLH